MTRVLVVYASKRGATAEIAHVVADTLTAAGLDADCREAAEVDSLDGIDAVVLGSAVYMRRWRGDARRFLRRHADELAARPFWIFSSGPVGEPRSDADLSWSEPRKLVERALLLGARDHAVFGGCIPREPRGMIERRMADGCPPEFRDRRDWDEIRRWARAVAAQLPASAPTR